MVTPTHLVDVLLEEEAIVELSVSLRTRHDSDQGVVGGAVILTAQF